jgi:carbamoyl-phosphate synthase small subunit
MRQGGGEGGGPLGGAGVQGLLLLEDGSSWAGSGFGAAGAVLGEVVFNTGMTGYQEVLTDPSYAGQIVVMTYPLIGNYGTAGEESESRRPWVRGFVVREHCSAPSHWGPRAGLAGFLAQHGIPGLEGVDTRALTRRLRRFGTVRGGLFCGEEAVAAARDPEAALERIRAWRPGDLVGEVSTPEAYVYARGTPHVVLVDYGAKANIARSLAALGAGVTVVPARYSAQEILALRPDGVLLSNGPGDPRDVAGAPETIRALLDAGLPIFGICLGHQLLGLALGGRTEKMLFGHRGVNHPVVETATGRGVITTQNHGYALLAESLDPDLVAVTHRNLHDDSVEGLRHRLLPAFSVQYHPEACPGPGESSDLFAEFVTLCRQRREALLQPMA